jgi:hypothetical protein
VVIICFGDVLGILENASVQSTGKGKQASFK